MSIRWRKPTATNWDNAPLDLLGLFGDPAEEPAKDSYQTTPEPEEQESMPDALTAEPEPFEGPETPDVDSIEVPEKPAA